MTPGERIDEFVQRIREAAGPNLQSIILYGSAAAGEFHSELSDINLLCIVRETSLRVLETLAPVIKWWTRRQPSSPLFMTRNELDRSADVFAIEFLDMRQQYRVLYGDDVLKGLDISMAHHRAQLEYELREKLLLLRQKFLLLSGRERQLNALLLESLPSFLTLFRHALIALGDAPGDSKRETVDRLARRLGFDPTPVQQALDARKHARSLESGNVRTVFAGYLASIEHVAAAVDTMLDSDKSTRSVQS